MPCILQAGDAQPSSPQLSYKIAHLMTTLMKLTMPLLKLAILPTLSTVSPLNILAALNRLIIFQIPVSIFILC